MAFAQFASKAPSAWNLQHWKFMVVTNQTDKEIFFVIANGQQQVVEASVVVVILGDLQADRI
ncbi:nitroreductase family protein [Robertmurraya sp. Marseille-Q9965]